MQKLNLGFLGEIYNGEIKEKQEKANRLEIANKFFGFNRVNPINPVRPEKSKRETKGNKGIYLKGLLETMTPGQAKEKFLEIYSEKSFGLKRFKIYMNDLQKGRY
jgi:hypothetical protein